MESSGNSIFLINNQFYKVYKRLISNKSKNESTHEDIEWITGQLTSDNRKICENAVNVLTEIDDFAVSLNSLISALSRSSSANFDLIADGIFKLLLNVDQNFGIINNPAILMISSESNERMLYLSNKIEGIIRNNPTKALKFLRPIICVILCNGTIYAESREIWKQILTTNEETIVDQILSLRKVTSPSSCLLFNNMIIMRINHSNASLDYLLLLIASTKYLVQNSINPSANLQLLTANSKVLLENEDVLAVVIFMLAEILQKLPTTHISNFLNLIDTLTQSFHHPVVNSMLVDGLIQFLAYPSFAAREISNVEKLLRRLRSNERKIIKIRSDFSHFNPDIMNAVNVCKFLETNELEMKAIKTEHEKNFWIRNHLVLRGFFQSNILSFDQWILSLENIIEISKTSDELKSSLVMPLLFKLAESHDARVKISILQNLTKLGALTEIFSTIKALSQGMLRSMTIDLHLRLWKIEPRTYPFLFKALTEKSPKDDEDLNLIIVQTHAIKEICDLKPHHGSDLVSIISEILNKSLETKDAEIPAALAIDAITILCQNHIINIASTWKAINLTTRYEKRPRVVKSLCNFFALVPKFKRNNSEYEMLMKDILERLFNMIQWSDTHGISCALEAMKSWNYDQLTLDMIPDLYREGIALPDAPAGMEVSILDLEVPGECYVQLLMKVNANALSAAGDLVSHFMAQEISEYRSGHYLVKDGQPEPISYKNLPKQSIVKALTQFVIQQATTKNKEKIVDELILIEALRVLAKRYSRPLPPLNWTFLHEMMHRDEKIKAHCVALSAKQAIISGTAKRLIENVLVNIDFDDFEDVNGGLNCLADICNGVTLDVLKIFFERAVLSENIGEKMENLLRSEKNISNRENLAAIISILVKKTTATSKIVSLIPPNIMHLISLTPTQKISFRCEILKAQSKVESAVAWMNELINEEFIHDNNRQLLITHLIDILTDTEQHFPSKKWLAEFITMVENKMIETGDYNFFLDIFCIALICVSGYAEITKKAEIFDNRFEILPQATELLSHHAHFDDTIGKLFEFIHFVIGRNASLNHLYQVTFKKSIVAAKNHPFFKKQKLWHKILQALIID